jgi:hypothetical protein
VQETDDSTESEETDEEEDTEDTEDETDPKGDEDEDDDDTPQGMENLPKGIVKRIKKQSAQIRELKAQLAGANPIQIAASAAMPLADIDTSEKLSERIETAKLVRKWCQANIDGGSITLSNGQTVELDADEVTRRLGLAERDIEAAPDRKMYLQQREQAKPWEMAKTIAPEMFVKDSPTHKFMVGILKECPELTRLSDYEVLVAAAAKGYKITMEERQGKARYIRMALDSKGNIVPPKQSLEKPKSKPPITPSASRPNLTNHGAKKPLEQIYASTKGNSNARVDALLEAAFA